MIIDVGEVLSWTAWPATMTSLLAGDSAIGDLAFLERQYAVNEDDRRGFRALYFGSDAAAGNDHDVAVQSYTTPDASSSPPQTATAARSCGAVGARGAWTALVGLALLALRRRP